MKMSNETPIMVLVIDKATRKVIDAERCAYSFTLTDILERHDFQKVELVLREPQITAIFGTVEEPITEPPVVEECPRDESEDVPF